MSDSLERAIRVLVVKVREEARAQARAELLASLSGKRVKAPKAPRVARKDFRTVVHGMRNGTAPRIASKITMEGSAAARRSPAVVKQLAELARQFVVKHPGCQASAIAAALHVGKRQLQPAMRQLREQEVVTMKGTRATARYTIKA